MPNGYFILLFYFILFNFATLLYFIINFSYIILPFYI